MSTPCERVIPGQVESDLYNEHISRYMFTKQFIKSKKVLDLGCGTGYGSKVMAEAARKVVGVDISKEAIVYAKEHFNTSNVSFHIEDCAKLGVADKSFDAVVSFEVIEHISDYTGFIKEARRVLKDDGIFILSTPNREYSEEKGEVNPYHVKEFSYDEFDGLLKGFFGQVQIVVENHCQGISISSPQCEKDYVVLPPDVNTFSMDHFRKTPSYFIAVCSLQEKGLPAIRRLFFIPSEANILREKDHHIKALQDQVKEFNKQMEWAVRLDAELQEKSKFITLLQTELEEKNQAILKLQHEFDERSEWAQKLDAELKERDMFLGKLQQEFEEKSKWTSQLDKELKEKNEYVLSLQKEFDEKAGYTEKLDAELKDTVALHHTLNQVLQEKDQLIVQLEDEIKKKAHSMDALQKQLQSFKNSKLYKLCRKTGLIKTLLF